jgi:hypothetical protein
VKIAVRREFMENLTLDPGGEVRFDAEVLLFDKSGQKTLIRNFLFSEGPETSPINDVHIARASCAKGAKSKFGRPIRDDQVLALHSRPTPRDIFEHELRAAQRTPWLSLE